MRHTVIKIVRIKGRAVPETTARQLHRDDAARAKRVLRAVRRQLREAVEWYGGRDNVPFHARLHLQCQETAANKEAAWHLAQIRKIK